MSTPLRLPSFPGSPLIVTAPVTRCGTTLLQRLLNSSPRAVVFGEAVAAALQERVSALLQQAAGHLPRREEYRRDLERALSGEQFWCPHLMPELEGYIALWSEALRAFLAFHEGQAQKLGRAVWGAKHPALGMTALKHLRQLVPGSKVLYLTRDVFAAARSAKARRFLQGPADAGKFAAQWAENVRGMLALASDPQVFLLRYEELERCDEAGLRSLEEFTGAAGMSLAVLGARVNTWQGAQGKGHAPDQYIAPAELTGEERNAIEQQAGEVIALYGGLLAGAS
jgi:hypothetical protein